jgi:hypothetical protein
LEIRLEFKWNSSGFFGIHEISRKFRDLTFFSIISPSDCGIGTKLPSWKRYGPGGK